MKLELRCVCTFASVVLVALVMSTGCRSAIEPGSDAGRQGSSAGTAEQRSEVVAVKRPQKDDYEPDHRRASFSVASHNYESGTITFRRDGSLSGRIRIVIWKNREDGEAGDTLLADLTCDPALVSLPIADVMLPREKVRDIRRIYAQAYYDNRPDVSPTEPLISQKDDSDDASQNSKFGRRMDFFILRYYEPGPAIALAAPIRSSGTFTTPIGFSIYLY
jgi:hypothetical protein